MCGHVNSYGSQKKVNSPLLELVVTKVKVYPEEDKKTYPNIHFVNPNDRTSSVIPTSNLVRQSRDMNPDVTEICVQ